MQLLFVLLFQIGLESVEYIKQVSASVAPLEVAVRDGKVGLICTVSLSIHTNLKAYGPFGDESIHIQFVSGVGEVIGFFGARGVLLDKICVRMIPTDQEDGDPSDLIEQS